MSNFSEISNWYQQLAAQYTSEQLKDWYSDVAEAYNQARPRYPQELIARAVQVAQLPEQAMILEIGSGPGIATVAFAEMGFSLVCLEPSQAASKLAKQNCASYPKVEIKNTTFEEYCLTNDKLDAVLAANAWHWVPPEIKYQKAAATLKDNGYLILLWNLTPQIPYEVYQIVDKEVYQVHAPNLASYETQETQEKILKGFGQDVINSGLFKNLISEQLYCETSYSIDDYLMLLSTGSPYKVLEPQQRDAVFNGLRKVLERNGESISVSYLAAFQIAKKI